MPHTKSRFNKRIAEIAERSQKMRAICIDTQFDEAGEPITDMNMMMESIDKMMAENHLFESVTPEHGREIVSSFQSSVREFEGLHGELPRDEVMASAHATFERVMLLESVKTGGAKKDIAGMMLESIGESMSSSQGVEIRAKMIGLILPVMLHTATTDAVTMMPTGSDEVEIFKIIRTAGSSFGDFEQGQEIDQKTVGQYSSMRQRYPMKDAQQPDGTITKHTFTSKTDLQNTSIEIPFVKGSVSLFANHKRICRDMDSSNGTMTGKIGDVIVNCTVESAKGVIIVNPVSALPNTIKLDIEFEVDIEKRPDLIPKIDHEMTSCKLRPSQNAIAADATIQAMYAMQREFNHDLKSMQMSHMRNLLANEKATRHLIDMRYSCLRTETFNIYVATGEDWKMHRERLNEVFLSISRKILDSTNTVGLTGMFCGSYASMILKTLGAPFFVAPEGYRQTNHIHFAGKLFGMWKVFEAPVVLDENEILCYGRGNSHSEAGYIAGDAIPATMYDHPIGPNLRSTETLYELAFGEIHPFDGESYFYTLRIVEEQPVAVLAEEHAA